MRVSQGKVLGTSVPSICSFGILQAPVFQIRCCSKSCTQLLPAANIIAMMLCSTHWEIVSLLLQGQIQVAAWYWELLIILSCLDLVVRVGEL